MHILMWCSLHHMVAPKGRGGGEGVDSLAVHDIVLVLFPTAYLWFAERALCFGARARVGAWINDGGVDAFATGSARGGSLFLWALWFGLYASPKKRASKAVFLYGSNPEI